MIEIMGMSNRYKDEEISYSCPECDEVVGNLQLIKSDNVTEIYSIYCKSCEIDYKVKLCAGYRCGKLLHHNDPYNTCFSCDPGRPFKEEN